MKNENKQGFKIISSDIIAPVDLKKRLNELKKEIKSATKHKNTLKNNLRNKHA